MDYNQSVAAYKEGNQTEPVSAVAPWAGNAYDHLRSYFLGTGSLGLREHSRLRLCIFTQWPCLWTMAKTPALLHVKKTSEETCDAALAVMISDQNFNCIQIGLWAFPYRIKCFAMGDVKD